MMVKRVSELHERNQPVTQLVFMTIGEITKIAAQLLKELKNVEFDEKSDDYAKLFARLEVSFNTAFIYVKITYFTCDDEDAWEGGLVTE